MTTRRRWMLVCGAAVTTAAGGWLLRRGLAGPACPACGPGDHVVPIVYGLVKLAPGDPPPTRCKLGGCLAVVGESPKWHCDRCGREWGVYAEDFHPRP